MAAGDGRRLSTTHGELQIISSLRDKAIAGIYLERDYEQLTRRRASEMSDYDEEDNLTGGISEKRASYLPLALLNALAWSASAHAYVVAKAIIGVYGFEARRLLRSQFEKTKRNSAREDITAAFRLCQLAEHFSKWSSASWSTRRPRANGYRACTACPARKRRPPW